MKRLVLVRHGDTSGGDLSPAGERQATFLGRRLRDESSDFALPDRLICSPAPRARQTASIIGSFLRLMESEEDGRLWSGPDGDPDSWEHDLAGLSRQLDMWGAKAGLLVVVTHYEICCGLPPLLAVRYDLKGLVPNGLARGEGLWVEPGSGDWRLLRS